MLLEDQRIEIWDGEVIMMVPASPRHEKVVQRVAYQINRYVIPKQLGELYGSNTAVYLTKEKDKYRLPDLTFVLTEREKELVREDGIFGNPDLIVEVLSPGLTAYDRDLIEKFQAYEMYRVKEYWIVDPFGKEIRIYSLQNQKYEKVENSVIFPGIDLSGEEIFRGLPDIY